MSQSSHKNCPFLQLGGGTRPADWTSPERNQRQMQMQKDLVVAGQGHREEDKQSQAGVGAGPGGETEADKTCHQRHAPPALGTESLLARSTARDHHPSRPLAHSSETHILDQTETPNT